MDIVQNTERPVKVKNSLAVKDIKQGASVRVVAVLQANSPLNYKELREATGISVKSLQRALDELRSREAVRIVEVIDPLHNESRRLVYLTARIVVSTSISAYDLAQEAKSEEDHINATIAIFVWAWGIRLERRYALQLLRLTNDSSRELYERLENTAANPEHPEHAKATNPLGYTLGILRRQTQKEANMQSWQPSSNGHNKQAEQEMSTKESIEQEMGFTLEDFAKAEVVSGRKVSYVA